MKKKKVIAAIISLLTLSAVGITAGAAYDSAEDPLISLSYLTDIFKPEMIDFIDDRFDEIMEQLEKEKNETESETETESESETDAEPDIPSESEETEDSTPTQAGYEVVELGEGDALYAVSACEIILRAGKVSCIAPDEGQGIADLTSADEIYDGIGLTKNHLCLIPRGDGRGIIATTESVFIMIRGDYTIVEE